jgi:hypothetical protein
MSKASEAGKAFLAGVLAKVPEALRAQVETALTDPTAEEALVVLGTGALAQSDINKKYDDLKAKETQLTEDYTKLNTWYETNASKLAEYDTLKANKGNGGDPPKPGAPPPVDTSKFLDRETFEQTMRQEQLAAANFLGLQSALTLSHYKDFGEVIDTRELLADKRLGSQMPDGRVFGLKDAYDAKYADKIAARDKQREDDRINKLVDAQVSERMKGQAAPYPIKGAPSPLDVLDPTSQQKPEQFDVNSAVVEYERLQAARQSA